MCIRGVLLIRLWCCDAVQVIKDAKSSDKADVYAFGILLWELATREQVGQPGRGYRSDLYTYVHLKNSYRIPCVVRKEASPPLFQRMGQLGFCFLFIVFLRIYFQRSMGILPE